LIKICCDERNILENIIKLYVLFRGVHLNAINSLGNIFLLLADAVCSPKGSRTINCTTATAASFQNISPFNIFSNLIDSKLFFYIEK